MGMAVLKDHGWSSARPDSAEGSLPLTACRPAAAQARETTAQIRADAAASVRNCAMSSRVVHGRSRSPSAELRARAEHADREIDHVRAELDRLRGNSLTPGARGEDGGRPSKHSLGAIGPDSGSCANPRHKPTTAPRSPRRSPASRHRDAAHLALGTRGRSRRAWRAGQRSTHCGR